jgi:hypothetical protein
MALYSATEIRVGLSQDEKFYVDDQGFFYHRVSWILNKLFAEPSTEEIFSRMKLSTKRLRYPGMSKAEILAKWARDAQESIEKGKNLHKEIEVYLKTGNQTTELPESSDFLRFKKWWDDTASNEYEPVVAENIERTLGVCITFSNGAKFRFAGTIDAIFRQKDTGKLVFYDWKRSSKLRSDAYVGRLSDQSILHQTPLRSMLFSSKLSYYGLQLNLYEFMESQIFGEEVACSYLGCFHPDHDEDPIIPVLKISERDLLQTLEILAESEKVATPSTSGTQNGSKKQRIVSAS